ncbi:nck-associated protein 5-like isoform X2 [Stigmatopora nigra]
MSLFSDHTDPKIRKVPLLEQLAEYMDDNLCIDDLIKQLEEERCNVWKEKLAVARMQREVARSESGGTMREKLIHELEEERRLRLESEKRLREVTEESELGRAQIISLQQQFSRMEETVRSLLQNQGLVDQTAPDTMDIMKLYKEKLSEEVQKQHDCPMENSPLPATQTELASATQLLTDASQTDNNDDRTKLLLERLKTLEERNSVLALENESQREQYERCLDEVANQVVQALVTQKDLREECLKLRTRVFDLEQQNRALGILFQQRIKPTSELLLQKLQSRIMDLSAADLLQEPEKSKAFLLSRNTSPSNDIQLNGKSGLPITKCLSQLSLTAPMPVYPRSSCSSSEVSLSSACSELSSGSYTWNDGRSCGKMHSSLTWDKRLNLGSSAPSNISVPLEEQTSTRRKETRILEGLRKLQRWKHRSSSSSRISKSGYKDCMNSNEGIYSLGIKSSSKGVSKPTHVGRTSVFVAKKCLYDSDDADDELMQAGHVAEIPTKDSWFHCRKPSHSISGTLCSWDGIQDNSGIGDHSGGLVPTKPPADLDSKDCPETLTSFLSRCLTEDGRPSAFTRVLHVGTRDSEGSNCLSDLDDIEELNCDSRDLQLPLSQRTVQVERISRDTSKSLMAQCLQRERGQTADGTPEHVNALIGANIYLSEERISSVFDAEGEPIELSPQERTEDSGSIIETPVSNVVDKYNALAPQERPTKQKPTLSGNSTVLDSPEKPSEYQLRTNKTNHSMGGNADRLSMQFTPQRKLFKSPGSRANKGHSIPPLNDSASPMSGASKLRGFNKPSATPIRQSKDTTTDASSGNSGNSIQEKTPPPSTTKISRFIKSSHSPKVANSKLPNRSEWKKGSSPSSPRLLRRQLQYGDNCEQPTRDKHCESIKNKLRSPSPPPPPGRTTSLLIKPNYEGSPQAHKNGVSQPSMTTTVRGPPPSYYTSLQPYMQATLPIKDKDLDMDAGYGTALAPQKLVEKTSQHLLKSSGMIPLQEHSITDTPKRITTKDYLPPTNSGFDQDSENSPKSSKNVPPPYSAVRGSSLHSSFACKRGSTHEYDHQSVQKPSVSLPVSIQEAPLVKTELQNVKTVSTANSVMTSTNSSEKGQKSRISMGFKGFLKSPPSHKNTPSFPDKQEKDHINLVSKETVTSNASIQCDSLHSVYSIDSPTKMSQGEVHCRLPEEEVIPVLTPEEADVCDKGKRSSQLFSRSISINSKSHLKPALGMNGAKARSQSFSTNYIEKPNVNVMEGQGKTRTHIITNSTERGSSLSRQSSLEAPSVGLMESPIYSPKARTNNQNVVPERTSKLISKGDESQGTVKVQTLTSPSHKEPCYKNSLNNICKLGKVTSHNAPPVSGPCSSENLVGETGGTMMSLNEEEFSLGVKTQTDSLNKTPDTDSKKSSPPACTIEEKVMMGIEENLQKCQEQEKVAASEAKQKTAPSLANWFGFRKSKLPAPAGKKADLPKGREEKKEMKIGSMLGVKQTKLDKKKDKKKNDSVETQNQSELNNKLSSIMDHCNNQMGQIASQIQCTTALIGKDQFVKELLGRAAEKANLVTTTPTGISTPKKHSEIKGDIKTCPDATTLLMCQKLKMGCDNKEGCVGDAASQDNLIGSSCQMRTLDSGIGTFPLPDSVTRANGRHHSKCDPGPDKVAAEVRAEPPSPSSECSQRRVKMPSLPITCLHAPGSLGHSFSDPFLTHSGSNTDVQTRLPKPSGANRTKRLSLFTPRSSASASYGYKDDETVRRRKASDHDISAERALRLCTTYSGSSSGSDTETELKQPGMTLSPLQSSRINCSNTTNPEGHSSWEDGHLPQTAVLSGHHRGVP